MNLVYGFPQCRRVTLLLFAALLMSGIAQAEAILEVWIQFRQIEQAVNKVARDFERGNPGTRVEVSIKSVSTSVDPLFVAMAAGMPPNLFCLSDRLVSDLVDRNALVPLDSFIAKSSRKDHWRLDTLQGYSVGGRAYGIPAFEGGPGRGVFFNLDHFDEAGLVSFSPNVPPTWDEMRTAHRKLTRSDEAGNLTRLGLYPVHTGGWNFGEVLMYLFDLPMDPNSGLPRLSSETAVDALTMFHEVYIRPYPVASYLQGKSNHFAAGHTSMELGHYFTTATIKSVSSDLRFSVTWAPHDQRVRQQSLQGWAVGVPAGARHLEETWRLIEALVSPQAVSYYYEAAGWLGGALDRTLARYINLDLIPGMRWFIESVDRADRLFMMPPPAAISWVHRANAARDQVFAGTLPPRAALEEAQRLMEVDYREYHDRRVR
jgi:ABC-type glycerol-3-phosphate transport system substrate-binding protein